MSDLETEQNFLGMIVSFREKNEQWICQINEKIYKTFERTPNEKITERTNVSKVFKKNNV